MRGATMTLSDAQKRLTARQDAARRAALGPPLDHDDAALSRLARVGPERLAEVEAFVRETAGERGVALLRAEGE